MLTCMGAISMGILASMVLGTGKGGPPVPTPHSNSWAVGSRAEAPGSWADWSEDVA